MQYSHLSYKKLVGIKLRNSRAYSVRENRAGKRSLSGSPTLKLPDQFLSAVLMTASEEVTLTAMGNLDND